MNQEQVKSSLRWVVTTFGGGIAGFLAGKGWVSAETVTSLLTSEVFLSAAASIAVGVWSLFVHKQSNAVAVVAAIAEDPTSAVKGIVTTNTVEGRALARDTVSDTVVSAGTPEATEIAKPRTSP